ncbi:MAG: GAF domain-containing protein [Magnetococcales bacterium]|nr:GAF domain-containing protein [Magnetococcales bacterium]
MKHVQSQLDLHNKIQSIINKILYVSLEPISLDEQLDQILKLIISIPGLADDSKGAIFLVSDDGKYLTLCVHYNMPKKVVASCNKVMFGSCLCGKAASSGELIFSNGLDQDHFITYPEILEHGHYCIPVVSGKKILGVISLYLCKNHRRDKIEEEFLVAVARTVAGIVERRLVEEALLHTQSELRMFLDKQSSIDLFSPALVRRFFANWDRQDKGPCWPPPKLEHAKTILEVVFVASLKKQEDKSIRVSVTFVDPPSLLEEVAAQDTITTIFQTPLDFSVESLVSIAPALDSITTSVIVTTVPGEADKLQIIGSVYFSHDGLHRFNAMDYVLCPLDLFSVSTREAGNLMVFRGESVIGCFSSGELCNETLPAFTESPLAWNLLQVVQSHPEFSEFGMGYWDAYRDLMDRLLLETSRRSHGGTIIWLPDDGVVTDKGLIDPRFPLESAPDGATLLREFVALELLAKSRSVSNSQFSGKYGFLTNKRKLIELTEYLAQMACHDGALVISDRLKPLSFGSMFTARTWQGKVVSWQESSEFFPSVQMNFSKLGMRHNSALNYVGQCPGSVAFVISQDGPIAGLTRKDEESIYWWPDCLNKMWRDSPIY